MSEDRISLGNIRARIKEKGVKWQAAVTSVSELSVKEQKDRLGLIPTDRELQMISEMGLDKPVATPRKSSKESGGSNLGSAGLPTSIDWREVNGVDWTTPIKNQGGCGSCVAFGTIAALDALLKICTYKDSSKNIDLSEAHLLWCGGGSCKGWHMNNACEYLKNNGVPDEACFPYQPTTMKCDDTCSDWKNRINHSQTKDWTNTKDVSTMKNNIVNNGPQITGMAVYSDFFSYSSGIYQHVAGGLAGYHCVAVVGYNDTDGCWICKNSWGTGWGENGWFRIAYGECGIQDVFGMWNMQVPSLVKKSDFAQYLLVDYSFTSDYRVLWAYAGGKWRNRFITDAQVGGIAKLLMESSKVYVWWDQNKLTRVRGFK